MVKQIAAHFLVLGLLFSLAIALPATNLPSISLTLEGSSLELNNTYTKPLNASQIIHYSIPQTQNAIRIVTGNTIGGPAMRDALESCLSTVHAAMSKHGDVYMFPDPLLFIPPPTLYTGLEILAHSTMVPGLKWTDLYNMLLGVEQVMISQRALYREAHVHLYDEPSGSEMGTAELYKNPKKTFAGLAHLE